MSDWQDVANDVIDSAVDSFFSPTPALFTPAGGLAYSVPVYFTGQREVRSIDEGVEVWAQRPVAGVRLSDFAEMPKKGDTIEIATIDYRVAYVDIDTPQVGAQLVLHMIG